MKYTFLEISKKMQSALRDTPVLSVIAKSKKDTKKAELLQKLMEFQWEGVELNYKILHKRHREAGVKCLYACRVCHKNLMKRVLYGKKELQIKPTK